MIPTDTNREHVVLQCLSKTLRESGHTPKTHVERQPRTPARIQAPWKRHSRENLNPQKLLIGKKMSSHLLRKARLPQNRSRKRAHGDAPLEPPTATSVFEQLRQTHLSELLRCLTGHVSMVQVSLTTLRLSRRSCANYIYAGGTQANPKCGRYLPQRELTR